MPMPDGRRSPADLYRQAVDETPDGDVTAVRARYRDLMVEHGHVRTRIRPDGATDPGPDPLPCGHPLGGHRR